MSKLTQSNREHYYVIKWHFVWFFNGSERHTKKNIKKKRHISYVIFKRFVNILFHMSISYGENEKKSEGIIRFFFLVW